MDSIITGQKHKYHIEQLIADTPQGAVYRAFVLRRKGKKLYRHYYAIVEHDVNGTISVDMPDASVEELFEYNGISYSVFVKRHTIHNSQFCSVCRVGNATIHNSPFTIHHFLMIALSILLLILVIVRF